MHDKAVMSPVVPSVVMPLPGVSAPTGTIEEQYNAWMRERGFETRLRMERTPWGEFVIVDTQKHFVQRDTGGVICKCSDPHEANRIKESLNFCDGKGQLGTYL